jgi:sec-independent protein translocase protein TatC
MSAEPESPAALSEPPSPTGYAGGPELTLLDHLKELRNRAIISAAAVVIAVLVCFYFWETILGWLMAPAREQYPDFKLSSFSPTDKLSMLFKIGLYGGLLLASPVVIYQVLAFVIPGLTPKERRMIFPGMVGATFFLLAGMAFAYWIILPASLNFLLGFGDKNIENVIGIKQYVDFTTRIIFWVGISFELPMVMALLARVGVLSPRQMLKFWRYAIVLCFVLAAIVTPTPDPLTQTLVGGPLLLLYIVGILLSWLVHKPRQLYVPA